MNIAISKMGYEPDPETFIVLKIFECEKFLSLICMDIKRG